MFNKTINCMHMNNDVWNPWHGCHKYSEGCKNCYMFRRDESVGRPTDVVGKTNMFDMPMRRNREGKYKVPAGSTIFACLTSDFFIEEADIWRDEAWQMIRTRHDVKFFIITKRITRFMDCVPQDWNHGYENVTICCTIENQSQCNIRFPVFNDLPITEKRIVCEPLLSDIDMSAYLNSNIAQVSVGGESGGRVARVCDYNWVLHIREQCVNANVPFHFKQTGANFIKDSKLYHIERKFQFIQAHKANIDN